ncbi:N-terminal C2 in EEIG1 and EHBP1 proteins-domain-containing protein [Epithele typhae]|uniref:N-terminal C2 in EEIG1 and EHBP1 proteins-domain-containing protein n=1 Tax=Epithele typhae TaxID=378194 RepID=UPI0020072AA4|nr:N-terminal C2 in EEIG1 and EHBP1 proteins-domain-containing protein [Epithele typhae]KAH9934553.1 N-terminal C2 in EEIG1 and EHBP1 proteins-domain-containing protein [Epithele typhae]
MKHSSNTTASTSSSGASSAAPNPTPHGFRTQLGHLLPRHALFQVHVYIDQLSNVPLIAGEFGARWKFKNVQSGSGVLQKMKGARSSSGKGKGKGKGKAVESETSSTGGADDGGPDEAHSMGSDSAHNATEDDHYVDSPRSPREFDDARALDLLHPPGFPTPVINSSDNPSSHSAPLQKEARGMTPWADLHSYTVKWGHSVNAVVQLDVHRETGDLLPSELKLVVMQRVIHGDPNAPQQPRLGAVYLNLAEYADAGPITRRYLLRQSKTNATLKLTIELEHIGGEKHYKPPPLRKGEILASVSGILSNNGLFSTRFARELDLYVGADKPEQAESFPYADRAGHVQVDRLAESFGLRTTEHLIEALFNPLPSDEPAQTPFTYYAPPQVEPEPERCESPLESYDLDSNSVNSSDRRSNGRRSVDSSASLSIASTSEHSLPYNSHDPGMASDAANMVANRHWWQKMKSRPSTPATSSRDLFRPATPAPPVPVRNG